MKNINLMIKKTILKQSDAIHYSGGPLNSYDKMIEIAIKGLTGTKGLSFIVCAVDRSLVPLCIQKIGDGNAGQCVFPQKEVLKFAVASSAYGLIIAHNSISAGVYCIADDLDIIRNMQTLGMMLGIHLIDYLIVDDHSADGGIWFLSDNLTELSGYYSQPDKKTN